MAHALFSIVHLLPSPSSAQCSHYLVCFVIAHVARMRALSACLGSSCMLHLPDSVDMNSAGAFCAVLAPWLCRGSRRHGMPPQEQTWHCYTQPLTTHRCTPTPHAHLHLAGDGHAAAVQNRDAHSGSLKEVVQKRHTQLHRQQ